MSFTNNSNTSPLAPSKEINETNMSLVIFAGAGCSVGAPASLPGWFDLNDAILEALWDRMTPYNLPDWIRGDVMDHIKAKRKQYAFPPDYQAQVMVERVGMKYFELLTVVDSDLYNAFHHYTAEGARAGQVTAVVTTNFDRNFERAFAEAGVPFRAFINEADFNAFERRSSSEIPVIKIHGSCSSPESMVDTRKQRLKGRAKSLEQALASLLREHPFLFAGFSGADLDDNRNYLGLRDAAPFARGFTFLYQPASSVRDSIKELIAAYGAEKASAIEADATAFLEERLRAASIPCSPFVPPNRENRPLAERLRERIQALNPMDAANMMFALAEANGDEPAARYLYDRVWKERQEMDYEADSFERFLLNHGRSYVFNFQDKVERARAIEVSISQVPFGEAPDRMREFLTNPAKFNLWNARNTSPETAGLRGLVQTYYANPILFKGFPKSLTAEFRRKPTITELADIIYYYSFYALVHGDAEVMTYLNSAIQEMEQDWDEPRLSQLLSRRAMLKFRDSDPAVLASAMEDVARARDLARKYHEPHLLALSALAIAIDARKRQDFPEAFRHIQEATNNYADLKRIPQSVEAIVEYLKILLLGFQNPSTDKQMLLRLRSELESIGNKLIIDKIPVFEPEFCYLMGMILNLYTDAPSERMLPWFVDAVNLSNQFNLPTQNAYFRETCARLGILDEVDKVIAEAKARQATENTPAGEHHAPSGNRQGQ